MEMRLARREDRCELRALWQECFGDPRAYIDFFYQRRFASIYVPVLTDENGKIVAMVHMLPCELESDDRYGKNQKGTNAYYLYAVGVTRAWRGQGAMRTLLSTIIDKCQKKSIALALSPVDEKLIPYYESYGFRVTGGYHHGFFDRSELESQGGGVFWQKCGYTTYFLVRSMLMTLCGVPRLQFPISGVGYALRENSYFGGCALYSSVGDCALVQKKGRHLVVREFCVCDSELAGVRARLGTLLDFFGATSCEVRSNLAFSPKLQRVHALMTNVPLTFMGQDFAYANLLLD